MTDLTEASIAVHEAKAIADAFSHEYIDNNDFHLTALRIETNPDSFLYLFSAMHDVLCEACAQLDKLEAGRPK